ncbi:hypothetical protein CEQ09_00245 [Enterococcus faecium]|nr:hypothetical protein CEQ09_00245 [Enterococcus faecium]
MSQCSFDKLTSKKHRKKTLTDFSKSSILALCQMMLVKRNLRIIWTEQKEENLFLFCLFG